MNLDKRLQLLLEKLYKFITDDEYVIVSFEEIARVLPNKGGNVKEDIYNLERMELIKIKYSDEKNICFASAPKGKLTIDTNQAERKRKIKKSFKDLKNILIWFAVVVAGTIVGNILTSLMGFGV